MGKKILQTIVAVLIMTGIIFGLMVDAPQTPTSIAENGSWLKSEGAMWTMAILILGGAFIWFLWRRPEKAIQATETGPVAVSELSPSTSNTAQATPVQNARIENIASTYAEHLSERKPSDQDDHSFWLGCLQRTWARDFTTEEEWATLISYLEDQEYPHPFKDGGAFLGMAPLDLFRTANHEGVDLGDTHETYELIKNKLLK